ncbi:unnamed protein product, partial [Onchocerca flexuosa]|uniref:Uncharacterized protein n=1 Tax=Onchocerca flexuosa TaxID=387005 RepID=A0A183HI17_9BILA
MFIICYKGMQGCHSSFRMGQPYFIHLKFSRFVEISEDKRLKSGRDGATGTALLEMPNGKQLTRPGWRMTRKGDTKER